MYGLAGQGSFATLVAAFGIVRTSASVANSKHCLCVSLDRRQAKTIWRVFGRRETTTSVVSDDKNVSATREKTQEC